MLRAWRLAGLFRFFGSLWGFLPRILVWSQCFGLPHLEKPVLSFIFHFNLRLKNSISVEQSSLPFHMLSLCFTTERVYIAAGWLSLLHKEATVWILATSQEYSVVFSQCVVQILQPRCRSLCKELKSASHRPDFLSFCHIVLRNVVIIFRDPQGWESICLMLLMKIWLLKAWVEENFLSTACLDPKSGSVPASLLPLSSERWKEVHLKQRFSWEE